MQIVYSQRLNLFEFVAQTEDERTLAERSGFRSDQRTGMIWAKSPELVLPFLQWADQESQTKVSRHKLNVLLSKAATADGLIFPASSGKTYIPFQLCGIAYGLPREKTLIGDDPGLGKTIQAAGIINSSPPMSSILIIVPATIKIKWARELANWLVYDYSVGIATSDYFPPTNIVIINYDIVHRIRCFEEKVKVRNFAKWETVTFLRPKENNPIDQRKWNLIIVDEAHMLQDNDAKRTQATLGYWYKNKMETPPIPADKSLFLTGTPMVNRPENLWSLVQACDREDLGSSWEYYGKRYCKLWKAPWGMDSSGAANLDELQSRLRGSFMIRRRKVDVLKDLPPKRRQIIPLDSSKVSDLVERGMKAYREFQEAIQTEIELRQEQVLKTLGNEEAYLKTVSELDIPDEDVRPDFWVMGKIRREEGLAKVPYTVEYVKMLLEERDKVVIYGHHSEPLDLLAKQLSKYKPLQVDGRVEVGDARQKIIDSFQEKKEFRIILCAITIAIGFELTAASCAVFHERDWRPSVVTQAEDRLHRIGQKSSVDSMHLVFDNSVDAMMAKDLVRKQEVIDQAIG